MSSSFWREWRGDPHGPILGITISGQTTINNVGDHVYVATVTGTNESYSVTWERDIGGYGYWTQIGSGPSYTYSIGAGEQFFVRLRATVTTVSSQSSAFTLDINVNTTCGGFGC